MRSERTRKANIGAVRRCALNFNEPFVLCALSSFSRNPSRETVRAWNFYKKRVSFVLHFYTIVSRSSTTLYHNDAFPDCNEAPSIPFRAIIRDARYEWNRKRVQNAWDRKYIAFVCRYSDRSVTWRSAEMAQSPILSEKLSKYESWHKQEQVGGSTKKFNKNRNMCCGTNE